MNIRVGTSGYSYKEWRGSFYPRELKASEYLSYYAEHLPAVEINNTFYRMPKRDVVASWRRSVPDSFRFAVKASQRITHRKRFSDPEELLGYLFTSLAELGQTLGCVLFQLPPSFRRADDRLDAFLLALPKDAPVAFEFRHRSWNDDSVLARLRSHGASVVLVDDTPEQGLGTTATADTAYLRLRQEHYSDAELDRWSEELTSASEAFVFFKHEDEAAGPGLAQRLLKRAQALAAR